MSVYGNKIRGCSLGIILEDSLEKQLDSEPFIIISDRTFVDELLELDFHRYERCTFKRCTFHLKYGNYRIFDCHLDSCGLQLEGPALGVAVLLKGFYKDQPIEIENEEHVMRDIY